MSLAENIKKLLKDQSLNMTDLSLKSGVPTSRISEIVSGVTQNPQMKTLKRLAEALNVPVDRLSGGVVSDGGSENFYVSGVHQKLTNDEHRLVQYFRVMDEHHRENLIETASCFAGLHKLSEFKRSAVRSRSAPP